MYPGVVPSATLVVAGLWGRSGSSGGILRCRGPAKCPEGTRTVCVSDFCIGVLEGGGYD